jgi:hypothetical protein
MHNTIVRVGGPRVPRAAPGGGLIPTVVRPRPVEFFPTATQPGLSQASNSADSGAPGPSHVGDRSPGRIETVSPPGGTPGSNMVVDQNDPNRTPVADTASRSQSRGFFGMFGGASRQPEAAGLAGPRPGQALLRIAGMEGGGVSNQLDDGDVQMG